MSDKSPLESKDDNLPQIDRSDRSPQKGGATTCHNIETDGIKAHNQEVRAMKIIKLFHWIIKN